MVGLQHRTRTFGAWNTRMCPTFELLVGLNFYLHFKREKRSIGGLNNLPGHVATRLECWSFIPCSWT